MYFYSFIVALLLFSGGGVFSIYEGVHKLQHPEPVGDITSRSIILGFSIAARGLVDARQHQGDERAPRRDAVLPLPAREQGLRPRRRVRREQRRGARPRRSRSPRSSIAKQTGDGRWDAVGSLAIGVVLVGVAMFLAREIKSLLVGESADPKLAEGGRAARDRRSERRPGARACSPIQQGPSEIVVAMKLKFRAGPRDRRSSSTRSTRSRRSSKQRVPEVRWSFIEPDSRAYRR